MEAVHVRSLVTCGIGYGAFVTEGAHGFVMPTDRRIMLDRAPSTYFFVCNTVAVENFSIKKNTGSIIIERPGVESAIFSQQIDIDKRYKNFLYVGEVKMPDFVELYGKAMRYIMEKLNKPIVDELWTTPEGMIKMYDNTTDTGTVDSLSYQYMKRGEYVDTIEESLFTLSLLLNAGKKPFYIFEYGRGFDISHRNIKV